MQLKMLIRAQRITTWYHTGARHHVSFVF